MDLLESIKRSTKDKELIKELAWAIEIIASNKLYDPILEEGGDGHKDKSEANLWLSSYNNVGNMSPAREPGQRRLSKFAVVNPRRASTKNSDKGRSLQRLTSLRTTPEAINIMDKSLDELDFNVFEFKAACHGEDLSTLMTHLFEKNSFFDTLGIESETFTRFILRIQNGYPNNPYHNSTHATDVVQTTNYLIVKGNFIERTELSNIELAAMYLASAVHDYEHPGSNNVFQINTGSEFAIRYNDKAVLENHHIAATFALLKDESLNIFKGFSREDYKLMRERMIAMVLATDMSNHFPDIAQFKGKLAAEFDIKKDKNFMMNMIVHSSDISNPSKQWDVCKEWTNKIVAEFFSQGDKERELGLPITNLCDRYTVNIAKSQIGFIDFVVAPLLNLMKEVLPGIDISNLESNKEKWKAQVEYYDKELAAQNEKTKAGENNNVQAAK